MGCAAEAGEEVITAKAPTSSAPRQSCANDEIIPENLLRDTMRVSEFITVRTEKSCSGRLQASPAAPGAMWRTIGRVTRFSPVKVDFLLWHSRPRLCSTGGRNLLVRSARHPPAADHSRGRPCHIKKVTA